MSFLMKIIIVGDLGVGKSSYLKKVCPSKSYISSLHRMNACLFDHELENNIIKLQMWEIEALPSIKSVKSEFYQGTHGAMVIFDISEPQSFVNVKGWLEKIFKHNGIGFIPVVILGNKKDLDHSDIKIDLLSERFIEDKINEINKKIDDHNFSLRYYPISVKHGLNLFKPLNYLGSTKRVVIDLFLEERTFH